jgi:hypothetical protein
MVTRINFSDSIAPSWQERQLSTMNLDSFKSTTGSSTPPKGFALFPYFEVFHETFNKSAKDPFIRFFQKNRHIADWTVFTDYAFYDKKKNADVLVFSFVPYVQDFNGAAAVIDKASFKDIKHLNRVNKHFLKLIRDNTIFNVAIILGRERRLCFSDEPGALLHAFDALTRMVEEWCVTTPSRSKRYFSLLADLQLVRRELKTKNPNLKIVRDIYITSTLAAYLLFEASKANNSRKVGWFSDRDSLLHYRSGALKDPLMISLTHALYHVFQENHLDRSRAELMFGIPEKDGKVWYDAFLRIPDLICATLADYDPGLNEFTHQKFVPVMEDLLADNDKFVILELRFHRKQNLFEAVRRTLDLVPSSATHVNL